MMVMDPFVSVCKEYVQYTYKQGMPQVLTVFMSFDYVYLHAYNASVLLTVLLCSHLTTLMCLRLLT